MSAMGAGYPSGEGVVGNGPCSGLLSRALGREELHCHHAACQYNRSKFIAFFRINAGS